MEANIQANIYGFILSDLSYFEQPQDFGSFAINTYRALQDTKYPESAKVVSDAMKDLMRFDHVDVDLPTISKYFTTDSFQNLNLTEHKAYHTCFKQIMETMNSRNDAFFKDYKGGQIVKQSPCINQTTYSECEEFCLWHEDLISNKLSKNEFLTLMR